MIPLLFVLGCAPEWGDDRVLAGARAHADRDGDGVITVAELPADTDGDGAVGDPELRVAVDAAAASWRPGGWSRPPTVPRLPPRGAAWAVLDTIRAEVLAVDPAAVVPTDEELIAASRAGPLSAPAAQEVLGRMKVAASTTGAPFPDALLATPAATAPR